jgi:uncharacterized membrane protein
MPKQPSSLTRNIVGPFLAGLLAILPLVLTVAIIMWLGSFLYRFIGPESPVGKALEGIGLAVMGDPRVAYLVGGIAVLGSIYLIGILVQRGLRDRLQHFLSGLINRLPLVRNVYTATQQMMSMFGKDEKTDLSGMSPVFCYFGGEGGTAVLALMPSPERFTIDGHDYHAVLIPTAPIPFGGGLLYVPAAWVKPAGFSVDGLLAIYVSMGVASGQYIRRDAGAENRVPPA